jgi:hypothetical protein
VLAGSSQELLPVGCTFSFHNPALELLANFLQVLYRVTPVSGVNPRVPTHLGGDGGPSKLPSHLAFNIRYDDGSFCDILQPTKDQLKDVYISPAKTLA